MLYLYPLSLYNFAGLHSWSVSTSWRADKTLGIPPLIKYPYYDETHGQLFPYKTLSMIVSFLTTIIVSYLLDFLFSRGHIPIMFDVFKSFSDVPVVDDHQDKYDSVNWESLVVQWICRKLKTRRLLPTTKRTNRHDMRCLFFHGTTEAKFTYVTGCSRCFTSPARFDLFVKRKYCS